jgi:Ca-activated chloride channel family protein
MTGDSNYYTILGVAPHASTETIREAFATIVGTLSEDSPRFAEVKQAFEVLSNPERRSIYDSLLQDTAVLDLTIKAQPSRDKLNQSNQNQLFYLMVDITPPNQSDLPQRPLNICLVLDRSTSMQGQRLQQVKAAVDLIAAKLTPEDHLSIVSFSDRAEIVLPPTTGVQPKTISSHVRAIQASGGTEIFQGLSVGFQTLQQIDLSQYTNHLILLTDGHTYGDEQECLQLARNAANKNVGISAFGLGSEWNDTFLDALVAPSGGQSAYIESPREIIDHLQKKINGLGAVFAENLRMKLQMPTGVVLKYAIKLMPFVQPLTPIDDELHLGHLEIRSPLKFIMEIMVPPQPIETRLTLPIHITADFTNPPGQRTYKEQVKLTVLKDAPKVEPSPEIVQAVRNLNFYRMNEQVWKDVDAGQLQQATQRMRHLTTRLLEVGETALAQQATIELERLQNVGELSDEGRKRLKYGTRALIEPKK